MPHEIDHVYMKPDFWKRSSNSKIVDQYFILFFGHIHGSSQVNEGTCTTSATQAIVMTNQIFNLPCPGGTPRSIFLIDLVQNMFEIERKLTLSLRRNFA